MAIHPSTVANFPVPNSSLQLLVQYLYMYIYTERPLSLLFVYLEQIFHGNYDRNLVITHRFERPFKARYVRIHPYSWHSHISMRFELYGCRLGKLNIKSSLEQANAVPARW